MTPRCKSSKQQLKHWLWRMVDSKACPGVQWLDRAQRSFKIPWINQKSSEWTEAYAQLFVEYAKYTGKLQTGGKIDHPKCKHNFKSAVGNNNKALKCLSKDKTTKYRVYKFEEDYSSSKDREEGNYQQMRSQSSDEGGDVWMEGIGVGTQELADTGTPQVYTEQLGLVQLNSGGESSAADVHQDLSGGVFGDAGGMGESGFYLERLQGGSKLVDLDNLDEMVATLAQSRFADSSVSEDSQIQSTTLDITTGIRSGSVEFPGDGRSLTATPQPLSNDVHESSPEINTQLTNSNMSMAGCTTIIQTDKKSVQPLLTHLEIFGHEAILSNTPGFLNSSRDITNKQFAVSLKNSSLQSLTNSLTSMEISEEENNPTQEEAALPTYVSSNPDPETTCPPSPGIVAPASAEKPNMVIQIIYSSPQRVVKKQFITSNKCKIFYGRVDNRRIQEAIDKKDKGAVRIELPAVNESNFKDLSKTTIKKTLERMEEGVVISYRDNDIYVTRRCQSKVFLTDGVSTSTAIPRSRMKEPDQEVKAFDFAMFEKSVSSHTTKTGCIGRDHFILTLGCEILKNDQNPTRVAPIRIDVQHFKAANMRFQALGKDAFVPDPQHSLSDSFDNQVHLSNATFSRARDVESKTGRDG